MDKENRKKASPEERVERMNSIFDRLILPMIIFTAVVFIGFAVVPKLGSCISCDGAKAEDTPAVSVQGDDFYSLRALLLADEDCMSLFESAGYTIIDNGDSGNVAYRKLDSGVMIIENLRDSNSQLYSAICLTDSQAGTDTTIMLYSDSIFLVLVDVSGEPISALFDSESFTLPPSAIDTQREAVLALVSAETLSDMVAQYKQSTLSVVE